MDVLDEGLQCIYGEKRAAIHQVPGRCGRSPTRRTPLTPARSTPTAARGHGRVPSVCPASSSKLATPRSGDAPLLAEKDADAPGLAEAAAAGEVFE